MTGNEFIYQLSKNLGGLPETERIAAIEYYSAYINDAAEDEAVTIERLGSPAEVAAKIIAEFAVKTDEYHETSRRFGLKTFWLVILAVFASPIALPIAIGAAIIGIVLLISLAAVLFAFAVSGVALVAAGIACVVLGIIVLFQNFASALLTIGTGLFALGLGILIAKGVVALSKVSFGGLARLFGKFILRRSAKQ